MIEYHCTPETKPFLEMYAPQMEQMENETNEQIVLDTLFSIIYADDCPDACEGDPYNIFCNKPAMAEYLEGENYAVFGKWILAYHFTPEKTFNTEVMDECMPVWM